MKIIVHRPAAGFEANGATGVLHAYQNILARKLGGVEVDVRVTSDGRPIVMHSPIVWRRGALPMPVRLLRYSDLPSGSFLGLKELAMVVDQHKNTRLYVEIKDIRPDAIENELRELEPFRSFVWFICLPWRAAALGHIRRLWPTANTNIIILNPLRPFGEIAHKYGANALTIGWKRVNWFRYIDCFGAAIKSNIEQAKRAGLEVGAGLARLDRDVAWVHDLRVDAIWVDPPYFSSSGIICSASENNEVIF